MEGEKEKGWNFYRLCFCCISICLLGFFWHMQWKRSVLFLKLRLSDLFLVGIGLIFMAGHRLTAFSGWSAWFFWFSCWENSSEFPRKHLPDCAVLCSVLCGDTSPWFYFKYTRFFGYNHKIRIFPSLYRLKALQHLWEYPLLPFRRSPILWTSTVRDAKAGNLLDAALYLSFFSKVISGPVALWKDFSVQRSTLGWQEAWHRNFLMGLNPDDSGFAKGHPCRCVWVAYFPDQRQYVSSIGNIITAFGNGRFSYMLQIYYDFPDTQILRWTFRVVWHPLKEKTSAFPYLSQSIGEFWRRCLYFAARTWFREYIYIPLEKSKGKTERLSICSLFSGYRHLAWSGLELCSLGCNQRCIFLYGYNEWARIRPTVSKGHRQWSNGRWSCQSCFLQLAGIPFKQHEWNRTNISRFCLVLSILHYQLYLQAYSLTYTSFLMNKDWHVVGGSNFCRDFLGYQNCWNRISKTRAVFCILRDSAAGSWCARGDVQELTLPTAFGPSVVRRIKIWKNSQMSIYHTSSLSLLLLPIAFF